MNFFDRYPTFIEDNTPEHASRHRARWASIFEANRSIFEGKRVLDLGSNNGKWVAAALDLGAELVLGVDGRQEWVDKAEELLAKSGFNRGSYKIVLDDLSTSLRHHHPRQFDTILCMGVFYHISNHSEILKRFSQLEPQFVVLDTKVNKSTAGAVVEYKCEDTWHAFNSTNETKDGLSWVGVPNNIFIRRLARLSGFGVTEIEVAAPEYTNKDKRAYILENLKYLVV